MKIEVIKSQEEAKWKFPCRGICKEDNLIIGFSSYGIGVVLDIGLCDDLNLYGFSKNWDMNDFEPLEEEKQPIDWDKMELPVWVKNRDGNIIQVESIKGENIQYCAICNNEMVIITDIFPTQGFAKQWLNFLEILPKGTKIEITI